MGTIELKKVTIFQVTPSVVIVCGVFERGKDYHTFSDAVHDSEVTVL